VWGDLESEALDEGVDEGDALLVCVDGGGSDDDDGVCVEDIVEMGEVFLHLGEEGLVVERGSDAVLDV
jgi:hypothetical protein